MKILVCVSKVPDTTSKIGFTENNTKFDENGIQFIINPYDEWYALVRALEITEANGGSVTTLTVGESNCDPVIRKALAIGANDAVRVNAAPADSFFVATQIASYAKENSFDMVILGKETIDYNGSQVGGMVAELMDLPFVSLACKLDVNGTVSTIEREVQGGTEVVEVEGNLVLSAAKGMSEQRIPNMRGIMAARSKPLTVVDAVAVDTATEIVEYTLPDAKGSVKMIDAENAGDLIRLLHEEAKVI